MHFHCIVSVEFFLFCGDAPLLDLFESVFFLLNLMFDGLFYWLEFELPSGDFFFFHGLVALANSAWTLVGGALEGIVLADFFRPIITIITFLYTPRFHISIFSLRVLINYLLSTRFCPLFTNLYQRILMLLLTHRPQIKEVDMIICIVSYPNNMTLDSCPVACHDASFSWI